jgi:hypothetical protein
LSLYQHDFFIYQQKGKRYEEKGDRNREKNMFYILESVYEDKNIKIKLNLSLFSDRNKKYDSYLKIEVEI